jgi:type I restriction enzyme, S subunit
VSDYTEDGTPLVFVRQVRSGNFAGASRRYITASKAHQLCAHRVVGGDVVITKMGEPPGDAAVYPVGHPDGVITADVIKFSLNTKAIPAYVALAISSPMIRRQFREITRGVAQQKVSLGRFRRSICIPIPEVSEQYEIVRIVEQYISKISRLESSLSDALLRRQRLLSSILGAAFSGQLVPHDPSDEPASFVLDRIAAEQFSFNDHRSSRNDKRRVRAPHE